MTETKNWKLKKPEYGDPVDIGVLNENFDVIDEQMGKNVLFCNLNLYNLVTINFSDESPKTVDITEAVNQNVADALNSGIYPIIRVRGTGIGGPPVTVILNSSYDAEAEFVRTIFTGTTAIGYSEEWAEFSIDVEWFLNGAYAVTLTYQMHKQSASERPVKTDLSAYDDGIIRLVYKDGGVMNVNVTFDQYGNPIKFSNGAEEFEVVWPAEVTS